jgi:hypothetical protein
MTGDLDVIVTLYSGTDIEGNEVIGERLTPVETDEASVWVETHTLLYHQATSGSFHQRRKVESNLFLRIRPTQITGHHSRVVMLVGWGHKREAKPARALDDQPAHHL